MDENFSLLLFFVFSFKKLRKKVQVFYLMKKRDKRRKDRENIHRKLLMAWIIIPTATPGRKETSLT